jgi:hypothetical protein
VNHYYDSLSWKPDQRDLALARIYADKFLFLGQCFARQKRPLDAIRAFEQAVGVAHDSPTDLEFARRRIEELRRAT